MLVAGAVNGSHINVIFVRFTIRVLFLQKKEKNDKSSVVISIFLDKKYLNFNKVLSWKM